MENESLVIEMKKLFEIFPEGVIISNIEQNKDYIWSNKIFDDNFSMLQGEIENLNYLKVKLSTQDSTDESSQYTTLHKMIIDHEVNAKLVPIYQHQNVDIECFSSNTSLIEESESKTIKTFCVKTLKINWEGNSNAYMHVFIDQTSIVKLEKAKNNIR